MSSDDFPEFFFESEQLALNGNADYLLVLKTLVTLEAQLVQATKEIDQLAVLKINAAEDPKGTAQKLLSGEITIPGPIDIAKVPQIDLSKYDTAGSSGKDTLENIPSTSSCSSQPMKRTKHLWSKEEQRRLEDLLVEFPTEKVEMQRFAKIAKALGTRTTNQVASRCQKYFKQLYLAGLPIPGRLPKSSRHAPYGSQADKYSNAGGSSSFFPEFDVPVRINEDGWDREDAASLKKENLKDEGDKNLEIVSQQIDLPDDWTFNDHITRLLIRLREDKLTDEKGQRAASIHVNHSCHSCRDNPINGTRWLCQTCNDPEVNFCTDCLITECVKPIDVNQHPVFHPIIGLRQRQAQSVHPSMKSTRTPFAKSRTSSSSSSESETEDFFMDEDYSASRINSGASYLDPNYPSTR